tara:strand:+ start:524 stop:1018 length:495 start_codon:yes stop_codon:yes gene_type:complete
MEKTEQQQINDKIAECLEDLSESMEMSAKNRDLIMRLIEFGDTRIDSVENKIDILMSERAEAVTQTKEDDVWYNEESKKAILNDIDDTTITPRALIELGFEEMYQDVDYGEPGYIYYTHQIKGVGFYSLDTESEEFHVKLDDSDYEIRNLRKLGDLILSLNEVS